MNSSIAKNIRHNYLMNTLDGTFFGFAMGFASFTTVIPLFLSGFTGSAILIGLIPAIRSVGYQLPPLFLAKAPAALQADDPAQYPERADSLSGVGSCCLFQPAAG
jgi:hypothetical protein